ncbi:MAG: STAS domain-containing protein [Eubacteriales bacterium]|nr:STAS domain-containing protein [Sarcina sp.]MBR2730262.1 STAS domain-containing protein [Lachnospiraceae bacterium]MDO4417242.1 STAS domain-containing protein [Eubacteriales bacterium]
MLNITKNANGEELQINLEGRLDTMTAPQLEGELKTDLGGVSTLIIDIEKLAYISSAGLRVLLSAQKIMNKQGSMIIRKPSEEVQEIFDVTGFSDILTIE